MNYQAVGNSQMYYDIAQQEDWSHDEGWKRQGDREKAGAILGAIAQRVIQDLKRQPIVRPVRKAGISTGVRHRIVGGLHLVSTDNGATWRQSNASTGLKKGYGSIAHAWRAGE